MNTVQKRCCVLWAKAHLKWTVSKWKSGQTSPNLTILMEITDDGVLRSKEDGDLSACHQRSKASISDGMGEHKCIRYGQLACFGRHYEC